MEVFHDAVAGVDVHQEQLTITIALKIMNLGRIEVS
jgi:hypothetical protein